MTDQERLARDRERRDRAARSVLKVDEGRLHHEDHDFYPAKDVTAEWRETKQREVDDLERAISENEQLNLRSGRISKP